MGDIMKDETNKDYYFPVLVGQIVIFLMISVMICLFGNDGDFSSDYFRLINSNINSVEISTAIETFRRHLYTGEIFTVLNITDDFTDTTESDEENNGVGGKDIEYNKAAKNTSFAPVFTTMKAVSPIEKGRYTSYFGYRINPISVKWGFHSGLDIAASHGTKIRAAFSGKVIKSGFDTQAGNYIYVEHNEGFTTFYCHCSELLVDKGTVVRQGETIALVGSTGYSTGPHLHFEVRKNNIRYNPLQLLEE